MNTSSDAAQDGRRSAWRQRCQELSGRTVLVVGCAEFRKRDLWRTARDYGLRIVLVEASWPFPPELGFGDETTDVIVLPDLHADHSEAADLAHCEQIVRQLELLRIAPDGVVTVWDECAVLAAMLAARLGLRGNPVEAQRRAKIKLETYRALAERAPDLAVPFVELHAPQDVRSERARDVGYPAVVKWCHGMGGFGTTPVDGPAEAERAAAHLLDLLAAPERAARLHPEICFRFGDRGVVLMEFIRGSEHDVDLLLFDGELVDAVVTDNAMHAKSSAEACALMPSALPEAAQDELIAAAYRACRALGLTDGAVNVELMRSPTGPKIIEINGRMGGVYIAAWVADIWSFDLRAAVFMIACGLHPVGRVVHAPRCHIAGVSCFPGDGSSPTADLGEHARTVVYLPDRTGSPATPYMSVGFRGASARDALAEAEARLPALFEGDPARARLLAELLATLVP